MLRRPNTNCNCLFLNIKMVIIESTADTKKKTGSDFTKMLSEANKSVNNTCSFIVDHILTKKTTPPDNIPDNNK